MEKRIAVTLLVLIGIAACVRKPVENTPKREILATIDGAPIYLDEFKRELGRLLVNGAEGLASATATDAQKKVLIENLIERRLLLREAEKKSVMVGLDEIDEELARMRRAWPEGEFDALLKNADLTVTELKREIRDLMTVRRYLRDHVFSRVAVTDEEIEDYLVAHPERAITAERVRARHIVVSTEDKAKEILTEMRRDLTFEEAAMQYSKSPEAKTGGDLGFFKRGEMPTVFDDVCFSLPVDKVSAIVPSDYGFHLFKVIERRPETARAVDEVREEIEADLLKQKQHETQLALTATLRQKAVINVKENRLATVL